MHIIWIILYIVNYLYHLCFRNFIRFVNRNITFLLQILNSHFLGHVFTKKILNMLADYTKILMDKYIFMIVILFIIRQVVLKYESIVVNIANDTTILTIADIYVFTSLFLWYTLSIIIRIPSRDRYISIEMASSIEEIFLVMLLYVFLSLNDQ